MVMLPLLFSLLLITQAHHPGEEGDHAKSSDPDDIYVDYYPGITSSI